MWAKTVKVQVYYYRSDIAKCKIQNAKKKKKNLNMLSLLYLQEFCTAVYITLCVATLKFYATFLVSLRLLSSCNTHILWHIEILVRHFTHLQRNAEANVSKWKLPRYNHRLHIRDGRQLTKSWKHSQSFEICEQFFRRQSAPCREC